MNTIEPSLMSLRSLLDAGPFVGREAKLAVPTRLLDAAARKPVQSKRLSEKLAQTTHAYGNRTFETATVIEELVGLAHDMRAV